MMPIELDDILSVAGRRALSQEQYARYRTKALAHLRGQFAPAMAMLPEPKAIEFIDSAYTRATRKGFERTREHLHFLNLCMFWGLCFDVDPQYRTSLRRAGWDAKADRPDMDTDALRIAVKRRHTLLAVDFTAPERIVGAFADLYDRPLAEYDVQAGVRLIARAFPAQFAAVPPDDWADMAGTMRGRCVGLGIADVDVTACVGLATILGAGFLDDPRFFWAKDALKQNRRDALAAGVRDYWDALSPVTEERT